MSVLSISIMSWYLDKEIFNFITIFLGSIVKLVYEKF